MENRLFISSERLHAPRHTQVKVSVAPETAAAFKANCLARGVSVAGEISRFMRSQSGENVYGKTSADNVATRQHRRKAIKAIIARIEAVMEAESRYKDSIPENLTGSRRYEAAEETVAALEEALDILSEAYA